MNEYRDIQASLLRFCSEFAAETTQFGDTLIGINVDGYVSPEDWPEEAFVGPNEVQMDLSPEGISVTLAFVLSTPQDPGLYKMDKIFNRLVDRLVTGSRLKIYDAVAGTPRGHLIVNGPTRAGRVVSTMSQPAKPLFVSFLSDQMLRRS